MDDVNANAFAHDTVLLHEAVDALNIKDKDDGVYVDGTYGRGGHSQLILSQLGVQGRLVAVDKDPQAIAFAQEQHKDDARFAIWHGSFSDFPQALAEKVESTEEITDAAGDAVGMDGLLLDLGVSSPQLDDAQRGFSFMRDGDLDMRMDTTSGMSAREWLAIADEKGIADVLWRYGEERFSRQIARKIVNQREQTPLDSTLQLAELIAEAVPKREKGKNPATRSFQAIRIKVNRELDDVEQCLDKALEHLKPGGRLVVISFHSLEDRIVKHFMRAASTPPRLPKGLPVMDEVIQMPLRLIGKAVKPSQQEIESNVRSRSAIMRIAEKV